MAGRVRFSRALVGIAPEFDARQAEGNPVDSLSKHQFTFLSSVNCFEESAMINTRAEMDRKWLILDVQMIGNGVSE